MEKSKDNLLKTLDMLLVISVLALIILITPLILAQLNDDKPESMEELVEACSDLSLEGSGQCVVEKTRGFYEYNMDNLGKELDFSELVDQGGVCSNWSNYYNEIGESLGFNTESIIIPVSGNLYHEFSVWSNEESYCVIDQTKLSCFEFGN